ncbi:hypothetical protein FGSG_11646 [Fusarium graminearum PH-1]|uniref:Chromosome 1, complete genome n=1 Tax=Gibberella zeae (strain ATCC MYA-4620 / CBS 123657 / FGSC 9075 / NRRL 31084 / PH-1) TaxID=229533 RepID=I1S479_GIBZE|nr:hypothetical protein FGSG_11646 [Fusarium graminearum PH-1]ESU05103.1 hypothetical protein FGSG_11646 [Fusarium graminearum PH-1]CEF71828.1 unnamed protein product [Fusarium graminearum]|eukprot:XP_011315588.1 hypothetical protein FGSG_11646 [Fusarium graminearum PH-1]
MGLVDMDSYLHPKLAELATDPQAMKCMTSRRVSWNEPMVGCQEDHIFLGIIGNMMSMLGAYFTSDIILKIIMEKNQMYCICQLWNSQPVNRKFHYLCLLKAWDYGDRQ